MCRDKTNRRSTHDNRLQWQPSPTNCNTVITIILSHPTHVAPSHLQEVIILGKKGGQNLNFFIRVTSIGIGLDYCTGGSGFEPRAGPPLRALKYLSRNCCLCNFICKQLEFRISWIKDFKPEVPSTKNSNPAAGVKEPLRTQVRPSLVSGLTNGGI